VKRVTEVASWNEERKKEKKRRTSEHTKQQVRTRLDSLNGVEKKKTSTTAISRIGCDIEEKYKFFFLWW
jgi:hypothetical protein